MWETTKFNKTDERRKEGKKSPKQMELGFNKREEVCKGCINRICPNDPRVTSHTYRVT